MNFILHIWRQKNNESEGAFGRYEINVSEDTSFLEMLDALNEQLIELGKEAIAFDFDLIDGNTIFYPYDLDSYLLNSSDGFYFDYDEFTNHAMITEFEQLLDKILSNNFEDDRLGTNIAQQVWPNKKLTSVFESNQRLYNAIVELGE